MMLIDLIHPKFWGSCRKGGKRKSIDRHRQIFVNIAVGKEEKTRDAEDRQNICDYWRG